MKASHSGMKYRAIKDDLIAPTKGLSAEFGTYSKDSIDNEMESILSDVQKRAISTVGEDRLKKMLSRH